MCTDIERLFQKRGKVYNTRMGVHGMRWTEEKLRTQFPAKVREERLAEGLDPDVRPTQEWIRDHGYSGIGGFAQRNDMSVAEVLENICGFEPRKKKALGIRHAQTRRLVKDWLTVEQDTFNTWGDNRVDDARSHFRKLASVAYAEFGSTDLLRIVRSESPADTDLLLRLLSHLSSHLETEGAQSNYTRSLSRWADYLSIVNEIDDHEVDRARKMMGYQFDRRSPEHELEPEQIRKCWEATETLEEKALLIILVAAGTRRAEPTNLKISQLRLNQEDPYIVFDDERKTGAATVPIMAGVEVIEAWIDQLEELDYWDGECLFPSKKSRDGTRPPGWVNDTVETIINRAGVTFPDGEVPTPKSFRSFWYNHYSNARQAWLANVEMLADEQGVSSAKVIDLHYLTAKGERDHFRKFAQSYFVAVFGKDQVHDFEDIQEARDSERDEHVQKAIDDFVDDIRDELRTSSNNEQTSKHESSAATDPISAWARARLRIEHASTMASDKLEYYPPSPKRAVGIATMFGAWAVIFGTFWAYTGIFSIDVLSGQVTAAPGAIIGLVLGFLYIATNLPDLNHTEPKPPRL